MRTQTAGRGRRCQGTNRMVPRWLHRLRRCSLNARRGLRAVIGVAGQNGRGPVNLLQKHDANHLMRPGRGAERDRQLCLAPQIGRKSVRAADHENSVGDLLRPASGRDGGQRRRCRYCRRARRASPARISPGLRPKSPRLPRRSGWRRRGRGFREFHGSRGRESRACGRCRRSVRDSARPVPAPGPASAGRRK